MWFFICRYGFDICGLLVTIMLVLLFVFGMVLFVLLLLRFLCLAVASCLLVLIV